jgi:hypothetical protein
MDHTGRTCISLVGPFPQRNRVRIGARLSLSLLGVPREDYRARKSRRIFPTVLVRAAGTNFPSIRMKRRVPRFAILPRAAAVAAKVALHIPLYGA